VIQLATFAQLAGEIRDAVRLEAKKIPGFTNGAIRILMYPGNKVCDEWLGGLGEWNLQTNPFAGITRGYNDIPDYEYCFSITPGGSRVAKFVEDDGRTVDFDCYAYSAAKIAHCSRAQDEDAGLLSGLDLGEPDMLVEENGFGPYLGAICIEINAKRPNISYYSHFGGLYVCVSGSTELNDLKCAFAAIDVVKRFFDEFPKDPEELPYLVYESYELEVPTWPKIYGLYTGGYDNSDIDEKPEWQLFLDYEGMRYVHWYTSQRVAKELADGDLSDADYDEIMRGQKELEYSIEYLLYNIAKRTGMSCSEPKVCEHIHINAGDFMRWYDFYRNWTSSMSAENWAKFETARERGEDVSEYLPIGDWHDFISG
jgi:hypothetical protein